MFCRKTLGFIAVKQTASILWTKVWSDAISLSWIVNLEEELTKLLIVGLRSVVFHNDGFDMVCKMITDIRIRRKFLISTRIAS